MRISDIINESVDDVYDSVLDLITVMAGEGLQSMAIDTIIMELANGGIDVDEASLFDLLSSIDIVDNIKDDVVYFNTDSEAFGNYSTQAPDPEKQNKTVDRMARKQVDKEIN
jgi:hypothetical protein